jgi:hypothetical protein
MLISTITLVDQKEKTLKRIVNIFTMTDRGDENLYLLIID